jgi:hypothetical protein
MEVVISDIFHSVLTSVELITINLSLRSLNLVLWWWRYKVHVDGGDGERRLHFPNTRDNITNYG